jgi:hypothetical protein
MEEFFTPNKRPDSFISQAKNVNNDAPELWLHTLS